MSYTFLQEQGGVSSVESFSDIPPSVLSRLNLTQEKSYSKDSETGYFQSSQFGMTSEPLTETHGEGSSMLFAEGSHARILAQQERARESREKDQDFGPRWRGSFARFNPNSHLWKTPQYSLLGGLASFSETWPEWGMMQDGECFHAPMLAVFTYENESGLKLPTPRSCTAMGARITENTAQQKFPNLETILARLVLPTIGKNENKGSSKKRYIGSKDFRGAKMSEGLRICEADPIYLNPLFAELVMMWPLGWTDLQSLETDKFQEWLNLHGKPSQKGLSNG